MPKVEVRQLRQQVRHLANRNNRKVSPRSNFQIRLKLHKGHLDPTSTRAHLNLFPESWECKLQLGACKLSAPDVPTALSVGRKRLSTATVCISVLGFMSLVCGGVWIHC